MLSIGILGFIVWGQMVALNITKCWNLQINKMKSASNFTSEIKCDKNFNLSISEPNNTYFFDLNNKTPFKKNKIFNLPKSHLNTSSLERGEINEVSVYNINEEFYDWFVGFAEGDGYFHITTNKKSVYFVFHLGEKDGLLLEKITKYLNMGTLRQTKIKNWRWVVSKQTDIYKLAQIFNGRIHFIKRHRQYENWLKILNNKLDNNNKIVLLPIKKLSLDNAWLSGLTDAEGCFNVTIHKGNRLDLRYILDQKYPDIIFEELIKLINGTIYLRKPSLTYRYTLRNPTLILDYLDKYPLLSKKKVILIDLK